MIIRFFTIFLVIFVNFFGVAFAAESSLDQKENLSQINPLGNQDNKNNQIQEVKDLKEEQFLDWYNFLYKKALDKNYDQNFINEVFTFVKYSDHYVKQDKKQFLPQTFEQYYKNAINNSRIKKTKKNLVENLDILKEIEEKFSVQKRFIIALWSIESDFGRIGGDSSIFTSLSNLSFDERRRDLFLKEFMSALEVAWKNKISPKDFKGSWAGATGQCQFLPSTYLEYGFDYDKDGYADIWNNKKDVMASIANYLKGLGWDDDLPWGYEVTKGDNLTDSFDLNSYYQLDSLVEKFDIKRKDKAIFNKKELKSKVKLVRQENRFFIIFENFDLIKKWNNSTYFALTVGLLSDQIDN